MSFRRSPGRSEAVKKLEGIRSLAAEEILGLSGA
jgi:hypothetical protein